MPGYGALIALVGLGAVAFIIVKDDRGGIIADAQKYCSNFMDMKNNSMNCDIYRNP